MSDWWFPLVPFSPLVCNVSIFGIILFDFDVLCDILVAGIWNPRKDIEFEILKGSKIFFSWIPLGRFCVGASSKYNLLSLLRDWDSFSWTTQKWKVKVPFYLYMQEGILASRELLESPGLWTRGPSPNVHCISINENHLLLFSLCSLGSHFLSLWATTATIPWDLKSRLWQKFFISS